MPFPRRKSPSSKPRLRDFRAALRPGIERDTLLLPWIVAAAVVHEAAAFLPTEIADWLDARAERGYARHPHFHRLVRRWLASRRSRGRLVALRWLPREFCFGGAG